METTQSKQRKPASKKPSKSDILIEQAKALIIGSDPNDMIWCWRQNGFPEIALKDTKTKLKICYCLGFESDDNTLEISNDGAHESFDSFRLERIENTNPKSAEAVTEIYQLLDERIRKTLSSILSDFAPETHKVVMTENAPSQNEPFSLENMSGPTRSDEAMNPDAITHCAAWWSEVDGTYLAQYGDTILQVQMKVGTRAGIREPYIEYLMQSRFAYIVEEVSGTLVGSVYDTLKSLENQGRIPSTAPDSAKKMSDWLSGGFDEFDDVADDE